MAYWGLPRGQLIAYAGHSGYGWIGERYGRGGYAPGRGVARPLEGNRFGETQGRGYVQGNRGYAEGRGYSAANPGYRQGAMEAYNRDPAPVMRQQEFSRSEQQYRPENRLAYGPEAYGSGSRAYGGAEDRMPQANRAPMAQGFRAPEAQSFRSPEQQAYRGPSESFQGGGFGGRGSHSFQQPRVEQPKSGGFHLFGGGNKEPKGFAQNSFKEAKFSAPRYSAPKFSAPKAPKVSKSFGGGGHSSGGHSSGGHSSGHHW